MSMKTTDLKIIGLPIIILGLAMILGLILGINQHLFFVIPGIIAVGLIFYQPFWGLLLLCVLIPLESSLLSLGGGAASVTKYLGMFVFAVWFIQVLARRYKIVVPSDFMIALIFISWGSITIFWAFSRNTTIARIQTAFQLLLLMLLVINLVNSKKKLYAVLIAVFIGCSIAAFLGVSGIRATSESYLLTLQNQGPNEYGSYIGVLFLFGSIFLFFERGILKLIGIAAILISGVLLFRVNERSVFLSIGISWVVIALFTRQKLKSLVVIVLIAIGFALLPAFLEQNGIINSYNVQRLTVQNIIETGGSGRTEIWGVGWRMFTSNFLIGVGWANFPILYPYYSDPYSYLLSLTDTFGRDPHGNFIGVSVEMGIIGAAILAILLVRIFLQCLKAYQSFADYQDKIMAILVMSLFVFYFAMGLTSTHLWRKIYWLILGMGILLPRLVVLMGKNKSQNE